MGMNQAQLHAAADDMAAFGCQAKVAEDLAKAREELDAYLEACQDGRVRFSFTSRAMCEFKDALALAEFHRLLRPAGEAERVSGIALNLRTSEVLA